MNYYNVLFDTDIGRDVSDALALSYLLTKDNCNINGITVVGGNPKNRAMIANSICRIAKKNVPIYIGLDPNLPNEWYPSPTGEEKLSKYEHSELYEGNFVDFMYSTIKNNPYGVTLIATGQLTNIAKLFEIYPNCAQYIKELRILGGIFNEELLKSSEMPFINWNVWSDPIAAKKVFNSGVQSIKVYGYEVVRDLVMPYEILKERANTPLLQCSIDFAENWLVSNEATFFDSLPVVSLFDDSICTYKRGKIEVNLDEKTDSPLYGSTTFIEDSSSNIEIVTSVDFNAFYLKYFELLSLPVPNKNLFMVCPKMNRDNMVSIPNELHIRSLKEEEIEFWKRFQFDTDEEYIEHKEYIDELFKKTYLNEKELFLKKCSVLVDINDRIVATCLLWNRNELYNTIEWLKVSKGYENYNLERAILSFIMKGIKEENYPLFLHTSLEEMNNIKAYSDLGFYLISKPDNIDNRHNDYLECIKIIKIKDKDLYNKLKQVDLSNYKVERKKYENN